MTLRITESKLAANRKDRTMIKVMIERHVKKGEDISPLLRDLRDVAMRQPGYITGETLFNCDNDSIILVVSIWQSVEDWKTWEISETRDEFEEVIYPLLVESPKVMMYQPVTVERTNV